METAVSHVHLVIKHICPHLQKISIIVRIEAKAQRLLSGSLGGLLYEKGSYIYVKNAILHLPIVFLSPRFALLVDPNISDYLQRVPQELFVPNFDMSHRKII